MRYIYFLAFFDEFNDDRMFEIRQTIVVPDECMHSTKSLVNYAINRAYPEDESNGNAGMFFEKGMLDMKEIDDEVSSHPYQHIYNEDNQFTFIDSYEYSPEIAIVYPTKVAIDFQNTNDDFYTDVRNYKVGCFKDIMDLVERLKQSLKKRGSNIYNMTVNILDKSRHAWATLKV